MEGGDAPEAPRRESGEAVMSSMKCPHCAGIVTMPLLQLGSRMRLHIYTEVIDDGGQEIGLRGGHRAANSRDSAPGQQGNEVRLTAEEKTYLSGFIAGCATTQTANEKESDNPPSRR
jgi:hypothetical protein